MYRKYLVIFISTLTIGVGFSRYISSQQKPNYLYMNSLSLRNHSITRLNKEVSNKIVFLGSSGVAGSNIPVNSTVSDYLNLHLNSGSESFNLGSLQATMPEVLVYFKQSLRFQPKKIILGISPSSMPFYSVSPVSYFNLNLIEEDIDPRLLGFIKAEGAKKFYHNQLLEDYWKPYPPLNISLQSYSLINKAVKQWMGHLSNKNFYGAGHLSYKDAMNPDNPQIKILLLIARKCYELKIGLDVYLEPIYKAEETYDENYGSYISFLTSLLNKEKANVHNYTDLIPSTPKHFVDFIHLTPEGSKLLAEKMHEDMGEL